MICRNQNLNPLLGYIDKTMFDIPTTVMIPIGIGELFDRISILQIKINKVIAEDAKNHVTRELEYLNQQAQLLVLDSKQRQDTQDLANINAQLWEVEDHLRKKENAQDFDSKFVELARQVYRLNDRRAEIKRKINVATGSLIIEQKHYER